MILDRELRPARIAGDTIEPVPHAVVSRRRRAWAVAAFVLALAIVVALLAVAAAAGARTVWLCRPGARPDPCAPGLSTTVYSPHLTALRQVSPRAAAHPSIDCFYVYPTTSTEKGPLSNLQIQPAETGIALNQVARYSQYCNVYAPMYRQVTLPALFSLGVGKAVSLAYGTPLHDVEQAFSLFLTRYSHGRGFVLIGHSQGSIILIRLIAKEIDPNPALRARLVSAILLGGNVLVKSGTGSGGDFRHIPACRSSAELHCVIAYSTFDHTPPKNSLFGRAYARGESVLCTNPAALSGGSGLLDPIFPTGALGLTLSAGVRAPLRRLLSAAGSVWDSYPGAYRARCASAGGASVLEVTPRDGAPTPPPLPTAAWGLHVLDANLALGNLVGIVGRQAAAYRAAAASG